MALLTLRLGEILNVFACLCELESFMSSELLN